MSSKIDYETYRGQLLKNGNKKMGAHLELMPNGMVMVGGTKMTQAEAQKQGHLGPVTRGESFRQVSNSGTFQRGVSPVWAVNK